MRGTDIDLWCWLKPTLNKNDEEKQYLPKWRMPYVIWHMYICMYEHTANKYWQNIRKNVENKNKNKELQWLKNNMLNDSVNYKNDNKNEFRFALLP